MSARVSSLMAGNIADFLNQCFISSYSLGRKMGWVQNGGSRPNGKLNRFIY